MGSLSTLKYPLKSHRKIINIPKESENLAELMGIIFGDGGINNPWQLVISLNSISDRQYSKYIINLLEKLFDIDVVVRKRPNQNTLVIVCSSTSLVDFLVEKGCVRGNKIIQQIDVPKWIRRNPEYEKRFVRGLVDTDGCLFIHKHIIKEKSYRNLGFCFTSASKNLIYSVADILNKFRIIPHITKDEQRIYLYSIKDILRYLEVFGSSNERIMNKYKEWINIKSEKGVWKNFL